jgi:uncharacterized membrane protein YccC
VRLQGTYHQLCEGVAREGADRKQRLRVARAECCEAAGAVEGIEALKLADSAKTQELLALLDRVAAMLTRLRRLRARLTNARPAGTAPAGRDRLPPAAEP